MKKTWPIFVLLSCVTLFSCDPSRVFEKNIAIQHRTWEQKNPLAFDVPVQDTVSAHDLYINVRNAGNYQYSNLFLFVKMVFPDGRIAIDTVECTLADPSGKWLGDGLGDIYDNQKLFKRGIRFPRKGLYRFEIEQAMRIDPLQGITDIGLRLEKADTK
jgi:gliding motility-associated lipoprotein GldH